MDWSSSVLSQTAVASVIAPLMVAFSLALIGAAAAAYLFLHPKRRGRYRGVMQKLDAHVNFDRFMIATILKFLYAFTALFSIVYGVILLFGGNVIAGLLWLVLAPLAFRVVFELPLVLLSLRDEASDTNELLRRMQGLPPKYPAKPAQPAEPQAQQPRSAPQGGRGQQPEPRYAQRQNAYPPQNGGFNGYVAVPRQPAPQMPSRQADFGASQRYAPARGADPRGGYEAGGYPQAQPPAQAAPAVRPTPADGTGRFAALPMKEKPE